MQSLPKIIYVKNSPDSEISIIDVSLTFLKFDMISGICVRQLNVAYTNMAFLNVTLWHRPSLIQDLQQHYWLINITLS